MPSDQICSHFLPEGLNNLTPSPDYWICKAVSRDTHIDAILCHMFIWPYGHTCKKMAIWPFGHMTIWHEMWPIWVSPEAAKRMQQSGEGIELIQPSGKKWEQIWSDGKFYYVFFFDFPMYIPKMMATTHTCFKTHQIFFGGSWGIDTATCTINSERMYTFISK